MSDGHYCIVRDLGLVKGGKGMKHHEVVVDFNRRGMVALIKQSFARLTRRGSPPHVASDAPPQSGESLGVAQ
jgi:hypothetical protein